MGRPYYDRIHSKWLLKIKVNGKWKPVTLARCEPPPDSPEEVPAHVLEKAAAYGRDDNQFAVQTLNLTLPALHQPNPIDLDKRLTRYVTAQCRTLRPNSKDKLLYIIGRFRSY